MVSLVVFPWPSWTPRIRPMHLGWPMRSWTSEELPVVGNTHATHHLPRQAACKPSGSKLRLTDGIYLRSMDWFEWMEMRGFLVANISNPLWLRWSGNRIIGNNDSSQDCSSIQLHSSRGTSALIMNCIGQSKASEISLARQCLGSHYQILVKMKPCSAFWMQIDKLFLSGSGRNWSWLFHLQVRDWLHGHWHVGQGEAQSSCRACQAVPNCWSGTLSGLVSGSFMANSCAQVKQFNAKSWNQQTVDRYFNLCPSPSRPLIF